MKSGKIVLRPRMSTNLWQLSVPSGPIMAWSSTFRALLREIFFSLWKESTCVKDLSDVQSYGVKLIYTSLKRLCEKAILIWQKQVRNVYTHVPVSCFAISRSVSSLDLSLSNQSSNSLLLQQEWSSSRLSYKRPHRAWRSLGWELQHMEQLLLHHRGQDSNLVWAQLRRYE